MRVRVGIIIAVGVGLAIAIGRYSAEIEAFVASHEKLFVVSGAILTAAFTATLWWSTAELSKATRESVRIARESADAAMKAANAIPRVERAYVFARPVLKHRLPDERTKPPSRLEECEIEVVFENGGKTPAVISALNVAVDVVPRHALPQRINEGGGIGDMPVGLVIGSGKTHVTPALALYTKEQMQDVRAWRLALYCYGRIEYTDILGERHGTGFCWIYLWSEAQEMFVIAPSTLNYQT